jgi:cyclopropane-fatty-acyl-phospholipid synthase
VNPEQYLRGLIRLGSLTVRMPGGKELALGDGDGSPVAVAITDVPTLAKIAAKPSLGLGEAYMDGRLVFEQGDLHDLLELAGRNSIGGSPYRKPSLLRMAWSRTAKEQNPRRAAKRNVHHHYDLSHKLYRSFLDADMQYSCAYFERDDMSLEEAQVAKKRHIAAKLDLADGQRVLDIGCGWGGLAMTMAGMADVRVHGVTLSEEQLMLARHRAGDAGLLNRVSFALTDYRDIQGQFDRIVSVGMFEHVGRPNYQAYFDLLTQRLTEDGVAVIHSIGRSTGPSATDYFTEKYIFPGGYIPALSEVLPIVEQSGLKVTDIEILRLHYAKTLRCWFDRFQARREEMKALYDERFCRMWEFYLAGAEMGFRFGDHMNFQIQLTKHNSALPVTRDYMTGGPSAPRVFTSLDERPVMTARPREPEPVRPPAEPAATPEAMMAEPLDVPAEPAKQPVRRSSRQIAKPAPAAAPSSAKPTAKPMASKTVSKVSKGAKPPAPPARPAQPAKPAKAPPATAARAKPAAKIQAATPSPKPSPPKPAKTGTVKGAPRATTRPKPAATKPAARKPKR